MSILVVAADDDRAMILGACLREDGHTVVRDREPTPEALSEAELVILDLSGQPEDAGALRVASARERRAGPLVAVGAAASAELEIAALDAGADDFVHAPLDPRVLRARVRRLLQPRITCAVGPMILDRGRRSATVNGLPLHLTAIELEVLWVLAIRAGQVVSRDQIYREVHHTPYDGRDRGVDIHVSRIRPKVVPHGVSIRAVRGTGYLLSSAGT